MYRPNYQANVYILCVNLFPLVSLNLNETKITFRQIYSRAIGLLIKAALLVIFWCLFINLILHAWQWNDFTLNFCLPLNKSRWIKPRFHCIISLPFATGCFSVIEKHKRGKVYFGIISAGDVLPVRAPRTWYIFKTWKRALSAVLNRMMNLHVSGFLLFSPIEILILLRTPDVFWAWIEVYFVPRKQNK